MVNKKIEVTTPGLMEFLEENVKGLIDMKPWMKDREFKLATTVEEVKAFIDEAIKVGKCVVDFETTGLSTRVKKTVDPATGAITKGPTEKIVGVGLCYNSKFGLYIPINHRVDSESNLPEKDILEELRRLCANCVTIYHNAKFDMAQLNLRGIFIDGFKMLEDTMVLARLYDSGQKIIGLKAVSERLLNQPMLEFKDMVQNTDRFDLVSPKIGYTYGASDAICTMDLYNLFINSEIIKSQKTICEIEKRVIFAVSEMESNLIKIDVPYLQAEKAKTEARIKAIEQEIYALAGHEFNMSSSQQLGKVLFEEKGFKVEGGMTESGKYATDEATLKKLAVTQPFCKRIIAYRGLEKSLNTYIKNLLANHDEDGCIKLGFNQSGTDTGRFSSPGGQGIHEDGYCGLNVQSLPKSTQSESGEELPDMRSAFIARPGKTLVAADYENEEMRIATNLSGEKTWINAINNGIDFHTATGAIIAGKSNPADVTPAERKTGKSVNFLALFMGGAKTLAANTGVSESEARRILNAFTAGTPMLKKWMDSEIKKARKNKYVKTLLGRTRPLAKYYDSGDRGLENHADRCVVNTEVQGLAADIMKAVMAKCYSWIHRNNLQEDVKMLITMHDELVFEITTEKLELLVPELTKIMMLPEIINGFFHWPIPLTVDVKYGNSWRMKKKFYETYPEAKKRLSEPLLEFSTLPAENPVKEEPVKEVPVEAPIKEVLVKETSIEDPLKAPVKVATTDVPQGMVVQQEPLLDASAYILSPVQEVASELPSVETLIAESNASDEFIYTLRDTGDITLLHLNNIMAYLIREIELSPDRYKGEKKTIKVRDLEGNSFLVSEFKFPVDVFVSFCRFFKI